MARLPGVPTVRNILRPVVIPAVAAAITLTSVVPAQAQARGRAVPRATVGVPGPGPVRPPVYAPGPRYGYGYGYYPYRPYYPWYGGFGFTIGFGFGYPYYPWYGAFGYGYPYGPYPYPYPFYPYYGYGYPMDPLTASLRLEVKPREAEVYVDGYRAGTVDDFDGTFQRLRMPPGEHTLVLYLDGFHKVEQQIYAGHGANQNIKLVMEKLAAGEQAGARPVPPPPEERRARDVRPDETRPEEPRRGRGGAPPDITVEEQNPRSFGVLRLNVQPVDAEILIDGAPWTIPAGDSRLNVQLPEGRHRVEIRKAGFATYAEEVAVQRGRLFTLNVSLIKVPGGGSRISVARAGGGD